MGVVVVVSDFSTCLRRRNQTDISHSSDMTEVLTQVLPHSHPLFRSLTCRSFTAFGFPNFSVYPTYALVDAVPSMQ